MKTRKNTTSRPNFTNAAADIFVVALSLLVIFISVFLFLKNLNKTFVRNDKTPVATVTFKYKSIQRKFLDRAVWDRPQQNSPVYNGDTIRTSPDAEATLYFVDRNVVELGSNTMIQIFVNNEEAQINLDSGLLAVETSDSSQLLVSSQGATARVAKGSSMRADKSLTDRLHFAVEKGEAAVITESGEPVEVLTEGAVLQNGAEAPLVTISPGKSAKILDQTGRGADVLFKWHNGFPEGQELVLETSPFSAFAEDTETFAVTNRDEFTVSKKTKPFYWRLYAADSAPDSAESLSGKVTIIPAPVPRLLEPEVEAQYTYMQTLPAVRFLWEGNSLAASYLLEVGDDPELNNPQFSRFTNTQSVTLSEFGEGTWYWRVTPRYLVGTESTPASSRISFFHIERTEQTADTPAVLLPQAVAETSKGKELTFAWKNMSESKTYRLKIAKDAEMKNVIVDTVVESNYFKLDDAAARLPDGEYYWSVSGTDAQGKELAATAPSKFKTVNQDFMLRSIFPPDGYILADTLCPDTRFTWKANVETEKHFQVSDTKDFAQIITDIKINGNGVEGVSLAQGQWYWRITAEGPNGMLTSEPKRVTVAPPLEKPVLYDIGSTVVVFPHGKTAFAWSAIPGADYYQVRITQGQNKPPIYENLFITDTRIEIPLQKTPEGNYRISIQGFAAASAGSTRRYGLAVDHDFRLMHLKPVELLYPADGGVIPGLDAALRPFVFKWDSVVSPSSSRLILRKSGSSRPVFEVNNPSAAVQAPPLEPGRYTWEVKAAVPEGFDISCPKRFAFTVAAIPPLPAAGFEAPKTNTVLNAEFFKSNRSIQFRWSKVTDATHYRLTIKNSSGRSIYRTDIRADKGTKPEVIFKDIARLSRGLFSVEVTAQRRLSTGKVFQDGKTARLNFTVDLPKGRAVTTDETGVLYGN
ncbi:MAG: FecR domain-containing protein [Treponema sp.]